MSKRQDWNCTYCSKSLTYKNRSEVFIQGEWLQCPNCNRFTRFSLFWEKQEKPNYKTSFGTTISMTSNISGARWYEFHPMPKDLYVENSLKRIVEKLNL